MIYQFPAFGSPFSQCFTTEFIGPEALTCAERAVVEQVAEKRAKDFSTGRFCARKALEQLGFPETEILMGADKEPVWPEQITGSISHSEKLAGAVVGRTDDIRSIGLDIETIGGVKPDLWNNLFNTQEQNFLKGLNTKEGALYSTLFFSMKESFYKLQYPITRQFLDFKEVEIKYIGGNFSFRSDRIADQNLIPMEGIITQWLEFGDQVISFCYLNR